MWKMSLPQSITYITMYAVNEGTREILISEQGEEIKSPRE
jgi:hypothetical protein